MYFRIGWGKMRNPVRVQEDLDAEKIRILLFIFRISCSNTSRYMICCLTGRACGGRGKKLLVVFRSTGRRALAKRSFLYATMSIIMLLFAAAQNAPAAPRYSDTALPPNPEEEAPSATYRRMVKDKELGLPVVIPSLPESPAAPPESPEPRPAVADLPRTPEEEARIDMYRRMAQDKEYGATVAIPSFPESPAAPPEPTEPPPRPAVADLPRTPEEEARIDMYRRMAQDKERGIDGTAVPAAAPGEVAYPLAPVIEALRIQ
jgi:hypothetical protein